MSHRYRVLYQILKADASPEEIPPNHGACDAVIVHSLIFEGGFFSHMMFSHDGRSDSDLSAEDVFKSWVLMGLAVSQMEDLSDAKRKLARRPLDIIGSIISNPDQSGSGNNGTGDENVN